MNIGTQLVNGMADSIKYVWRVMEMAKFEFLTWEACEVILITRGWVLEDAFPNTAWVNFITLVK